MRSERSYRRRLRRAILAEARRVAREHSFGCSFAIFDADTGRLERIEPAREFAPLSELLHLCAQLDGRLPRGGAMGAGQAAAAAPAGGGEAC